MKKILTGVMACMLVLSLCACGNPNGKEIKAATERGMKALEDGEYQQAMESFDRALDLGSRRDETEDLYEILRDYLAAKEAYDAQDYQTAERKLDDLDDEYRDYDSLRRDVRDLKDQVEQALDAQRQAASAAQTAAAEQAAKDAAQSAAAAQAAAQAASAQAAAGAVGSSDGSYLFPSDTQYLTVEYLNTLSNDTIDLIRNEIYARHGYIFKTKKFADYFNGQPWYVPTVPADSFDTSVFNAVENANLKLLVGYQGL